MAPAGEFYDAYAWCLDPTPTLGDLLRHLGEEMERYETPREGWEREECRVNFYLFVCAIACAVDDHLAERPWSLATLAARFPGLRRAAGATEAALNLPHRMRSRVRDAGMAAWRRRWSACVDAACDLLLGGDERRFIELARRGLAEARFPGAALARRMRIPEGFRCQDLTHQDVCAMAEGARASLGEKDRSVMIVGPRTAGGYFAPLAAAFLRSAGYTGVRWITVRPRAGFSAEERRAIAGSATAGAAMLIIDDHQNTGRTMRLLIGALRELGAQPRNITVAIPAHPARPDWKVDDRIARDVRFAILPAEDRRKARLLESDWAETLLKERLGAGVELRESEETAALNAELASHSGDGFQVRLKRVFDVHPKGEARSQRVVAKSVGWGWLGYHAWIAGSRLEGLVPRPLALRDGMLVSEWVEGTPLAAENGDRGRVADALGAYVAARVRALPLHGDPGFDSPAYRWCGWDDLVAALGGVYGPYAGRLKARAIRKRLRRYVTPWPALVDGSMKPADWVSSGGALSKTDFEQHNFGGGERDIVDSAWDLAAAAFEFELSGEAERRLIESYAGKSGDAGVAERLLLYKILYALVAERAAAYWIGRMPAGEQREDCNRRYIAAQDFATFHMARHCGRALGAMPDAWTRRLFFLDLDGVFDWNFLGFPHTTPAGVEALRLLRSAGFSVVLNTARSLEHVRAYCEAYRLPGGVAEPRERVLGRDPGAGDCPRGLAGGRTTRARSRGASESAGRVCRSRERGFRAGLPLRGRPHAGAEDRRNCRSTSPHKLRQTGIFSERGRHLHHPKRCREGGRSRPGARVCGKPARVGRRDGRLGPRPGYVGGRRCCVRACERFGGRSGPDTGRPVPADEGQAAGGAARSGDGIVRRTGQRPGARGRSRIADRCAVACSRQRNIRADVERSPVGSAVGSRMTSAQIKPAAIGAFEAGEVSEPRQVAWIETSEEFERLGGAWKELFEAAGRECAFLSFEWMFDLVEALGEEGPAGDYRCPRRAGKDDRHCAVLYCTKRPGGLRCTAALVPGGRARRLGLPGDSGEARL